LWERGRNAGSSGDDDPTMLRLPHAAVQTSPASRDTGSMPVRDLDEARVALRDGKPAELLGAAECEWLDVKAGVYLLDDPAKADELAKDGAAIGNGGGGGLLLVGFSTRVEHGMEILDEIRPVPRGLVDLDRHRKVLRRIIPPLSNVTVSWIDHGADRGILVIDVPAQPPARLPYVVPGPTRMDKVSGLSVAVPVREADGTHWLPQAEIQRLLAAGWAAAGGPDEKVLRDLIASTVAAARQDGPPPPAFHVAEGESAKAMLRPVLEGRIVPWTGRSFGKSHRLEVRIKTHWPLATIYVEFPSDPRTGLMGFVLEAPKFGNELFRPGRWVTVGDVNYTESPVDDDLVILARCRNEEWVRWDDIVVPVKFPARASAAISDKQA
jgi:hypothetical protein